MSRTRAPSKIKDSKWRTGIQRNSGMRSRHPCLPLKLSRHSSKSSSLQGSHSIWRCSRGRNLRVVCIVKSQHIFHPPPKMWRMPLMHSLVQDPRWITWHSWQVIRWRGAYSSLKRIEHRTVLNGNSFLTEFFCETEYAVNAG